jgi:hypothetical protein
MINKFLLLLIGGFEIINGYNFYYVNFKTKIHKSLTDSLINFIKINNINNLKIKENSKYLILNYKDEYKIENEKINVEISTNLLNITNDKIYIKNELENYNNYDNNKNEDIKEDLSIYERIIINKKPILIISEKNDENKNLKFKYRYLIKDKNNYTCSYLFRYNKKNYKYLFDIIGTEINRYETDWDITAKIRLDKINMNKEMEINLLNWIKYNTNDNYNNNNYYYKKYLLINYYYNK